MFSERRAQRTTETTLSVRHRVQVVLSMVWFSFDRSSAVHGFWWVLSCLLRWATHFTRVLGGYFPSALHWRNDTGVGPGQFSRSETHRPVWGLWRLLFFPCYWILKFVRVLRGFITRAILWGNDARNDTAESDTGEKYTAEWESPQFSADESDLEDEREVLVELDHESPGWNTRGGEGLDSQGFCRVKTTDEYYCDYDSTWETEECEDDPLQFTLQTHTPKSNKFRRFESAARDMQNYRRKYPNQKCSQSWNDPDSQPNLNFYLGKTPSRPDAVYITDFHKDWYRSYDRLESVHTFIQWLFPLPEPGLNYEATPLTKEEIEGFHNNSIARDNLFESYKLMLDFYGINLRDRSTGEVERASHWRDRFRNLNSHSHNNLRITRILKCLGILGFPHYQAPLVHFFLNETLVNGELQNVRESALNYFLFAVLDREQRRDLIKFAYDYNQDKEFVWCPKIVQEMWSYQSEPQGGINVDYEQIRTK